MYVWDLWVINHLEVFCKATSRMGRPCLHGENQMKQQGYFFNKEEGSEKSVAVAICATDQSFSGKSISLVSARLIR